MEHILYCLSASETHNCFGSVINVIVGGPIVLFLLTAWIRGLWRHFNSIFGLVGKFNRWRRRNKPYSKVENVFAALISQIQTAPELWQIIESRDGMKAERIDGRVTINNVFRHPEYCEFYGWRGPIIRVVDNGKYSSREIRPELTEKLQKEFRHLQEQKVCETLLEPPVDQLPLLR